MGSASPAAGPIACHPGQRVGWQLLFGVVVAAGILFLAGCGQRETQVARATANHVLLIGNGAEPEDLDPQITRGIPGYKIETALFEGLVGEDPAAREFVPGAAARWTISPDGLVYTFYLQPNGRWSNGDPVTAADFVYSLHRALSPALGNTFINLLGVIRNAAAFYHGKISDFSQVGIAALDEHTLQITLEHPVPYFLGMLVHNTFFPVHQATIEKFGRMDERSTPWTRPGNLVGNGPFVLSEWRPSQVIAVRRNPYYWDAAHVKLAGIRFFPIESDEAEEAAFRAGQLHVTYTVPIAKIPYYRDHYAGIFHSDPYLGVYFYECNVTKPPLNNADVRRALSLAIDRRLLVDHVTQGNQRPAYGFFPPDSLGYTPDVQINENADEARTLLAHAGYPNGRGFPPLQLLYNTSGENRQVAEAIQAMWRKVLHIDVQIYNEEWAVYLNSRQKGDYQIARAGWVPQYNDVSVFADLLLPENGNNDSRWSDPQYASLVHAADREIDAAKRRSLYQQAEAILLRAMPVIPIYYYRRNYLMRPEVSGWEGNPVDQHPFKYIDVGSVGAE